MFYNRPLSDINSCSWCSFVRIWSENPISKKFNLCATDLLMEGPTDGPTDGPRKWRRYTRCYRDARAYLKTKLMQTFFKWPIWRKCFTRLTLSVTSWGQWTQFPLEWPTWCVSYFGKDWGLRTQLHDVQIKLMGFSGKKIFALLLLDRYQDDGRNHCQMGSVYLTFLNHTFSPTTCRNTHRRGYIWSN